MDRKVKAGAVSYLNTKPLIYGFEQGEMRDELDLVMDYPANIARLLTAGEIDLGLVPVAVLPEMKEYYIVGDHCIGCNGPVASVCLFSQVPMHDIETVLLDYQSRTSVALVQVLMKEFWKRDVVFEAAEGEFQQRVQGKTAALVIGDRAFDMIHRCEYVYDLGEAWKSYTGKPFVFAVWAANFKPVETFTQRFNTAGSIGFSHLPEIIEKANVPAHYPDLLKYFTRNIRYRFGPEEQEALAFFLEKLRYVAGHRPIT